MHCVRTPELNLSKHLQDQVINSIDSGDLVQTNMGRGNTSLEEVLSKIENPSRREYIKSIYSGYNATGFTLTASLEKELLDWYSNFLSVIDEEPKITIKVFTSDVGLPLHSDKKQSCSLTTLVSGYGPITEWYEIRDNYKHLYYEDGELKGNSLPMPEEVQLVDKHKLEEWDTCLFDHKTVHKVDTGGTASKRIMLSVGWLNTPYSVVEQKYKEWKKHVNGIFKK